MPWRDKEVKTAAAHGGLTRAHRRECVTNTDAACSQREQPTDLIMAATLTASRAPHLRPTTYRHARRCR